MVWKFENKTPKSKKSPKFEKPIITADVGRSDIVMGFVLVVVMFHVNLWLYIPVSVFQLENSGLRELLGISREAFLVLKREDASESTSLSPLLTSADVSLRKS